MGKSRKLGPQNSAIHRKKRPRGKPFPKGNPPIGKRFEKGVSGNPGGRPKTKMFVEAYKAVLEAENLESFQPQNVLESIALGIVSEAQAGKVTAASEIADRVEGRVPIRVNMGSGDNTPLLVESLRRVEGLIEAKKKSEAQQAPPPNIAENGESTSSECRD